MWEFSNQDQVQYRSEVLKRKQENLTRKLETRTIIPELSFMNSFRGVTKNEKVNNLKL